MEPYPCRDARDSCQEAPTRSIRARPERTIRLVLLLVLSWLTILAGGHSTASALIVRLAQGRHVSFQPAPGTRTGAPSPFDSVFHNLDYNGGPVMSSNTNYTFYWAPPGAPGYPPDYRPGIDRYFEDLAHDSGGSENVDSVSTQYNDATGAHAAYISHFGGALIDTNPYPASGCSEVTPRCLGDLQIQEELESYLKAQGLPLDLQHEYFVLLPPGVEACFGGANAYCSAGTVAHERESFCAYHSAVPLEGGRSVILYANDPYVVGGRCDDGNHPNGSSADAAISAGLSHEHNESLTDPEPNGSWADWATGKSTGLENGDKCRTFNPETEYGTPLGTAPNGAKYDQVINGHLYWNQQEWSNQGHQCMQRLSYRGEEPHAAFSSITNAEGAKLDASASTAPGGVADYAWQLNLAEQAPIESTAPTLTCCQVHGVYKAALTVFAADGTSNGTMHYVTVGGTVPSITRISPSRGPAGGGSKVTITGINLGGTTEVMFGSTPARSFVEASPTKLVSISPPHGAGAVDVTVTDGFATSATSAADRYRFSPIVTGVSPSRGSRRGGTIVTVTGLGFEPGVGATDFKLGAAKATAVSCASSTSCMLTTPKGRSLGTVDVVATANQVSSAKTTADHFTYE